MMPILFSRFRLCICPLAQRGGDEGVFPSPDSADRRICKIRKIPASKASSASYANLMFCKISAYKAINTLRKSAKGKGQPSTQLPLTLS
jgi:hypothetical protein